MQHFRECFGHRRLKGKGEVGAEVRVEGRKILNATYFFLVSPISFLVSHIFLLKYAVGDYTDNLRKNIGLTKKK